MVKLSVVVLNWNGKQYLNNCLGSLSKQNYKDFEVILVDNGSTDGSVDYVRKNFPKARVIENKKNLGFTIGNNIGIEKSKGRYVFILNNDTKLDKSCLKELVNVMDSNKKIGMVSAKMLFFDSNKVDTLGLKVLKWGFTEDIKKAEQIPFCPCGGAAFYRKAMLEDTKLDDDYFDSDYFIYADDYDLGFRARLRGWDCRLADKAIVYHLHGATMSKETDKQIYLGDRNRIWTIIKNYPNGLLAKCSIHLTLLQILSNTQLKENRY